MEELFLCGSELNTLMMEAVGSLPLIEEIHLQLALPFILLLVRLRKYILFAITITNNFIEPSLLIVLTRNQGFMAHLIYLSISFAKLITNNHVICAKEAMCERGCVRERSIL